MGNSYAQVYAAGIAQIRDLDARIAWLDDCIAELPGPGRPGDREAVFERRDLTHRRDKLRVERDGLVDHMFRFA